MICSDAALSALDGRLASSYRRALGLVSNPEPLKAEQRSWLTTERKRCADVACLREAYQQRLTALEVAAPLGKEVSYSFTKAPFINPKIVNDLSTGMSDQGDQVLAIDLTDVLFTAESGGGSGVFEGLMLVRISEESGAQSVEPASSSIQTLTYRKNRLVLKKVGEIGLGDRWDGILAVNGNEISIGKDTGALSRVEGTPARVVKIESPP